MPSSPSRAAYHRAYRARRKAVAQQSPSPVAQQSPSPVAQHLTPRQQLHAAAVRYFDAGQRDAFIAAVDELLEAYPARTSRST